MYIIEWNHESLIYINDTQTTYDIYLSKLLIYFIGYYKSHGVGIRVI